MKATFFRRAAIYLLAFLISGSAIAFASSKTDGVQVQLIVPGCNNNGICEPSLGETVSNCALDCSITPPPPPPATSTPPNHEPDGYHVYIVDPTSIRIQAGTTTASISWASYRPALSIFYWGETTDLEQGSLSEVVYGTSHAVRLDNLIPDTVYYFKIYSRDLVGDTEYTSIYSFRTLPLYGTYSPENISDFHYIPTSHSILLRWKNPTEVTFNNVRIMRSTDYYPRDPFDGTLVYEASGEGFEDVNVVPGTIYYYTAFAVEKDGTYSSGVLLRAMMTAPGTSTSTTTSPIDFGGEPTTTGKNNPGLPIGVSTSTVGTYLNTIGLSNFLFTQKGIEALVVNGKIKIDGSLPLTVTLPITFDTTSIKNISIHIQNPYDKNNYVSYLFQLDKVNGTYKAFINPLLLGGDYPFKIVFYDLGLQAAKEFTGVLDVSEALKTPQNAQNNGLKSICCWFCLILLIILILILLRILTRREKDKTSPQQ